VEAPHQEIISLDTLETSSLDRHPAGSYTNTVVSITDITERSHAKL